MRRPIRSEYHGCDFPEQLKEREDSPNGSSAVQTILLLGPYDPMFQLVLEVSMADWDAE